MHCHSRKPQGSQLASEISVEGAVTALGEGDDGHGQHTEEMEILGYGQGTK